MADSNVKGAMGEVNTAMDVQKVKTLQMEVDGIRDATARKEADSYTKQLM